MRKKKKLTLAQWVPYKFIIYTNNAIDGLFNNANNILPLDISHRSKAQLAANCHENPFLHFAATQPHNLIKIYSEQKTCHGTFQVMGLSKDYKTIPNSKMS